MKIAVIGSGIAGLSAAYFLSRKHDVTVFEADSRLGGHTNTVEVDTKDGKLAVDTGFIVCNPVNYANFYPLLKELDVKLQDTNMSLGVSVDNGRVEWAGDENIMKIFAQKSLLFSPTHIRMLLSVLKFNKHVKRLLTEDKLPDVTLGEFMDQHGYPLSLKVRYVAAMAGPIWSTSTKKAMDFPFPHFARFFDSHGLLNVYERPQWQTVVGGSSTYVRAIADKAKFDIHLNSAVTDLNRTESGVRIKTSDFEGRFDAAVCATHSDQALNMLNDASDDEREVLGNVPFANNIAYLHTDESLLPKRKSVWSSWNALITQDNLSDDPIAVTYWMNRLQNIESDTNYIVSLNPPRPPRADSILYQTEYAHPQYQPATVEAQDKLPAIQYKNHIAWAGAWTAYGFHEDGLKSGLRAVKAIDDSCLPEWTSLPNG